MSNKFITPTFLKTSRTFGILSLLFSFFAAILGFISAKLESKNQISYTLYAALLSFFTLIFMGIEHAVYARWSWINLFINESQYLPILNVNNELIVLSLTL